MLTRLFRSDNASLPVAADEVALLVDRRAAVETVQKINISFFLKFNYYLMCLLPQRQVDSTVVLLVHLIQRKVVKERYCCTL